MKPHLLSIILLCTLASQGQDPTSFKLTLTTFNHAERIFDGITTYVLNGSSITIEKQFLAEKRKTVYKRSTRQNKIFAAAIEKMRLDTLEELYDNRCIMATSGNEYFLSIESNALKKKISAHHFYLQQFDDIIRFINKNVPSRYRHQYLDKMEKQDCKPSL